MNSEILNFYESIFNLSRHSPQKDAYLPYHGGQLLIVQNPTSVRYILGENLANYPRRYDWFRQCIGISRFTENPPKWQGLKKVSQPFLNNFNKSELLQTVKNVVNEYREQLCEPSEILNEPLIRTMAIDIFCRNFFGFSIQNLKINFALITELLALSVQYAFIKPGEISGRINKEAYQRIFELKREMLEGFKELRDPKYHKSLFIQEILKAEKEGILFFEQELMFLFSVGIETTVHSLGWTLYILAQYPELQQSIKHEMKGKIASSSSCADYDDLVEINNVLDWSLKRYPPTPCITRESQSDDKIGDFVIQPSEVVMISLVGMLYDPNDDMEQWIMDKKHQIKHNLAFSYGQRICGGKQYATVELVYLLAAILQEFDIVLLRDDPIIFHWYSQLNRLGGHPIQLQKC